MIGNSNWERDVILDINANNLLTVDQLQQLKDKHKFLFSTPTLFLKLVKYNTRDGLKLKTLHIYLRLIQIFFKLFKIMAKRRRRRVQRFIFLNDFEFLFQRMLNLKQLMLTKKLVRKRGRHKKFDYKFLPLYKNKCINQLMYWLRLLSIKYNSRSYITRMLYIYYDFLFLKKYSYVVKLHKSLRGEYFFKKKKKFINTQYLKKKEYLGKISKL